MKPQFWTPYLAPYAARFDAQNRRERLLIMVAVLAGVVLFGYAVLIEAPWSRQRAAQQQLLQQKTGLANLQQQRALMQTRAQNLGAAERAQLEKIQQEAEQVNQHLQTIGLTLVAPDQVADFLAKMLKHSAGVQLRAVRNLPVSELATSKKSVSETPSSSNANNAVGSSRATEAKADAETALVEANPMFRHGVEITLVGSYADLLNYVSTLEKMPHRVLWGSLKLAVEEYPRARMTLTVYTLSLDRTWLTL